MIRRLSGQRRIGHTGTLDPMASGVLVLCLGLATRLVEYYQGHDKQYMAEIRLGTATDTYDAVGEVTATKPVPPLDESTIELALSDFRGEIEQRPPAYSAIKQQGEALHRKARRGETALAEVRTIVIHALELIGYQDHILRLRVRCSAGTYIRSLAHDLGVALGTVAHLDALRREAAGPFTLEHTHSLHTIEEYARAQELDRLLLPMGFGLDMPCVRPTPDQLMRFGFGQQVTLQHTAFSDSDLPPKNTKDELLAQVIATDGSLAGIIRFVEAADGQEAGIWRAAKWLAPAS